jgi:hypothetical protein
MKHNYFSEVSLFVDIIPQHPDALVSSLHSFYNCHEQQHRLTALLISLHVIPNHRVVVLTHCDQSVDSCLNCAVYNLHRHINLHCTLGTRFHVSVQSLSAAGDIQYMCQLQYVLPLSSTSKLLATCSNLTLLICYSML